MAHAPAVHQCRRKTFRCSQRAALHLCAIGQQQQPAQIVPVSDLGFAWLLNSWGFLSRPLSGLEVDGRCFGLSVRVDRNHGRQLSRSYATLDCAERLSRIGYPLVLPEANVTDLFLVAVMRSAVWSFTNRAPATGNQLLMVVSRKEIRTHDDAAYVSFDDHSTSGQVAFDSGKAIVPQTGTVCGVSRNRFHKFEFREYGTERATET